MKRYWLGLLVVMSLGRLLAADGKPQLLLPRVHAGVVCGVTLSDDGSLALSGGWDNTAILWDTRTGKALAIFKGHKEMKVGPGENKVWPAVLSVAISANNNQILTGGSDATAILWDVKSAKPLQVFKGHTHWVTSVAMSRDCKRILTGSFDNTAILWDGETGKPLKQYKGHLSIKNEKGDIKQGVFSVAMSADCKRVLTGASDKTAILWNAESAKPINILAGHTDAVKVAICDNGNIIFTSSGQKAYQWNDDGSKLLKRYNVPSVVNSISTNRDGNILLLGLNDNTAILCDPETGKTIQQYEGHGSSPDGFMSGVAVAMSRDGKRILTGGSDRAVALWDSQKAKPVQIFGYPANSIASLRISADGRRVITLLDKGLVLVWDTEHGKLLKIINLESSNGATIEGFSTSGKRILTDDHKGKIILWNAETAKSICTLKYKQLSTTKAALSGDGKRIVTCDDHTHFIIWDTDKGKTIKTIEAVRKDNQFLVSLGVSRDGKYFCAGYNKQVVLWDIESGKVIQSFNGHNAEVTSIVLSVDGKHVLTGSNDKTAKLWDVETGKTLRSYQGHTDSINYAAMSIDGKWILTTSPPLSTTGFTYNESAAVFWNTKTAKPIHQGFKCSPGDFLLADFATNIGLLVTTSSDSTVNIWRSGATQPILSFLSTQDDWFFWTPEGYYTCSPEAEKLIAWKIDDPKAPGGYRIVGPDQFRKTFYRPDLFPHLLTELDLGKALAKADKLRGNKPSIVSSIAEQIPPVVIIASPLQARSVIKTERCEIAVKARGIGDNHVASLQLLVGGRPHNGGRTQFKVPTPRAGEASARWTIDLAPGEHLIQVVAEGIKGSRSRPEEAQVTVIRQEEKVELPTLFLLGIGVSGYTSVDKKGVEYTAADAKRFLEAQSKHASAFYSKIEQIALTDGKASKTDILDAFDELSKKARKVPKAVVMIYMAGHGKVSELGDFYFLAADSDPKRLRATGLSGSELKNALKDIPGRIILYLDACHSGAFAGDNTRSTGLTDDLFSELTAPDCGVVVICSSRGKELSGQSYDRKVGYFTLAVEEGLSGKPVPVKGGKPGETYSVLRAANGVVYLPELFAFINRRVKDLSDGKQNPYASDLKKVGELPLTKP